ncbi:MAG: uvrB, partial [Chloroflexi bacterium]|nr:uvrB [Chloroflexota bacterium]
DLTDSMRVTAEEKDKPPIGKMPKDELARIIKELEKQMKQAAQELEFEKAALLRDQILALRQELEDEKLPEWERVRKAR